LLFISKNDPYGIIVSVSLHPTAYPEIVLNKPHNCDSEPIYDEIVELLRQHQQFRSQNPHGTLAQFGAYLQQTDEQHTMPALPTLTVDERITHFYRHQPNDTQAALLLLRISRFMRYYHKLFTQGITDISFDELGFLFAAFKMGLSRKSDLIAGSLIEPTTGAEIINRLVRRNLFEERPNPEDRRSKLVGLTQEGYRMLAQLIPRMAPLHQVLSSALSPSERQLLIQLLAKMNDMHTALYFLEKPYTAEELMARYANPMPEQLSKMMDDMLAQIQAQANQE